MGNVIAQLVITLQDNGQVEISGPIENKMLVYGMLESARDAIQEHTARVAKGGLVVPKMSIVPPGAGQNGNKG